MRELYFAPLTLDLVEKRPLAESVPAANIRVEFPKIGTQSFDIISTRVRSPKINTLL